MRTPLAGVRVVGLAAAALARPVVPAEFKGSWVPAKSAWSPLRMVVGDDQLTLDAGSDCQALGSIKRAGPGYFPPDYRGQMASMITLFDGEQRVTANFNPRAKKVTVLAEFASLMSGKATSQLAAYNARNTALKLAKRFALDKMPPKKCTKWFPAMAIYPARPPVDTASLKRLCGKRRSDGSRHS